MVPHLFSQWLGVETRESQCELASQTRQIYESWVQMSDLVLIYKVDSGNI